VRRAAVWLALASLLALSAGEPFHPDTAITPRDGTPFTVSSAAADAASLPHGGAHLPGLCSICRAAGHARLGLHAPTIALADPLDSHGLSLPHVAQQTASPAPWIASIAPRAPPDALPFLNS
jgi:hypothetical protein